MVKRVRK